MTDDVVDGCLRGPHPDSELLLRLFEEGRLLGWEGGLGVFKVGGVHEIDMSE